jgi:shikimate dehydrogenase
VIHEPAVTSASAARRAGSAGRRAAVLGSPIAHSLSPVLHRSAYADLGLTWTYEVIECDAAGLPALLGGMDDAFVGLSLTMPLKRAVLPLCDEVSPLAAAVGAANTITFDGIGPFRRRRADNTDVGAMVAAIRARIAQIAGGPVAILGAGGTAAAAIAAVRELDLGGADVVVRDPPARPSCSRPPTGSASRCRSLHGRPSTSFRGPAWWSRPCRRGRRTRWPE